jgi:uncharacterized protein (TIGR02302 family)
LPDPSLEDAGASQQASTLLGHALRRARLIIFWERLWPALAALSTAIGLFLAVSWLGLWLWLPPLGRAVGLLAFVALIAASLIPFVFLRMPDSAEGLRRLDRSSGLRHRPATAISDELAVTASDPVSLALWRAHVERALRTAARLRVGWPAPRLVARDPLAMRALIAVLLVATFVAAGDERGKRLAAAFDWRGVVAPKNFRVDAWVTPPSYTGRPPVILPGLRPGEPVPGAAAAISVPAGSILVIRGTGDVQFDVAVKGGIAQAPAEARPQAASGADERRFTVNEAGSATVQGVGRDVTWAFTAVPDRAPTIALAKDPEPQARGGLLLAYKLEDDYGITEAQAVFTRKSRLDGAQSRALFGAPDFTLVLPQARTRNGVGQTTKDLTEHPWAGTEVNLTLVAKDEAGNEGRSDAHAFRLPQRVFTKPVARALIEQRRNLALDADAKATVMLALDALSIAPERFTPEKPIYLGLRSIYWNLNNANTDDALRDVVARLWSMALAIEDGNLSDVEQALRAAQE